MPSEEPRPEAFPQTRWSVVLDAQGDDPEALATLCKAYWFPLYGYARRLRENATDAEDLTQAFFAHLLSNDLLNNIQQHRGRLRGWLQVALKNFATSQWRKEHALKRGGQDSGISIDGELAERLLAEMPSDQVTPEIEFDRCWAREVLSRARAKLAEAYRENGKADIYEALQGLIDPALRAEPSYTEAAEQLGLSVSGTRFHAFKLRRRFRETITDIIADTVSSSKDIEEELAYLQNIFENPNP